MSPTVRIDNEVFDKLKEHAEPLVDTPNSVLRRLLGLAPRSDSSDNGSDSASARAQPARQRRTSKRSTPARLQRRNGATRAQAGTTLPEGEYEIPILEILRDSGGRAPTREVIDALGEQLDGRLTSTDRAPLASGDVRWRNRAQFVRLSLIQRGDMRAGSPRGIWEISEQGLERVGAPR